MTVTGNTVTGCNNGLYAYDISVASSGNTYCNNNDGAGMYIAANTSATATFDGDIFCNNSAPYWNGAGAWVSGSGTVGAANMVIRGSSFSGNEFDAQNTLTDQLDARLNWWNGEFCGNAIVSGDVLYDPCLSSDPFADPDDDPASTQDGGFVLPQTGFAPDRVTVLDAQPAEKDYAEMAIILNVPSLGISANVVGVPHYEPKHPHL